MAHIDSVCLRCSSSGDYILALDSYTYEEGLYFDRDNVSFTIQGGFGSGYYLMTGVTSNYGNKQITAGTVAVDNKYINPAAFAAVGHGH